MITKRLYYPKWFDQTPLKVSLTQQNEDGENVVFFVWEGKGNYQENVENQKTTEGEYEHISGIIRSKGDIFPGIPECSSGFAEINGSEVEILRTVRVRNPDGTINHTKVLLK